MVYGAQRSLVVFRLFKIELANFSFPSESIPQILQLEDIWYGRRASQNSVSTSVDWCRLLRTYESRNSYTILKWISRRRKGWISIVEKAVNKLNVRDVIHNISIATQFAMRTVK